MKALEILAVEIFFLMEDMQKEKRREDIYKKT